MRPPTRVVHRISIGDSLTDTGGVPCRATSKVGPRGTAKGPNPVNCPCRLDACVPVRKTSCPACCARRLCQEPEEGGQVRIQRLQHVAKVPETSRIRILRQNKTYGKARAEPDQVNQSAAPNLGESNVGESLGRTDSKPPRAIGKGKRRRVSPDFGSQNNTPV